MDRLYHSQGDAAPGGYNPPFPFAREGLRLGQRPEAQVQPRRQMAGGEIHRNLASCPACVWSPWPASLKRDLREVYVFPAIHCRERNRAAHRSPKILLFQMQRCFIVCLRRLWPGSLRATSASSYFHRPAILPADSYASSELPVVWSSSSAKAVVLNVFLHILSFYQKRLPDLPPQHSVVRIYWKYEINKLLQFRMIYKNLHWLKFMVQ